MYNLLFALVLNAVRPLVVLSAILAVHDRFKPRLDLRRVGCCFASL